MKKLIIALATVTSFTLASCGGSESKENTATADSTTVCNSTCADSTVTTVDSFSVAVDTNK